MTCPNLQKIPATRIQRMRRSRSRMMIMRVRMRRKRMTRTMIQETAVMLSRFRRMVMVCIQIYVHSITLYCCVHAKAIFPLDRS